MVVFVLIVKLRDFAHELRSGIVDLIQLFRGYLFRLEWGLLGHNFSVLTGLMVFTCSVSIL